MFRALLKASTPLVNHQNARGMATLKQVSAKLSPENIQKLKDFVKVDPKLRNGILRELAPPMPQELPQAFKDGYRLFFKSNWRDVTVKQAWLNLLITTEVVCWFFVGEVIGKGNLIGYQV